jgi:hypothetical protein
MTFKTSRPRAVEIDAYSPPRVGEAEEVIGLIQGQIPMSKEEWWVSQWLDRRRYGYKYQHVIFAGADHFYKLDFLVYTVPLATMVEPLGNHWHTDKLGQDDRQRQLEIESAMRDIAKIPIRFIDVEDMINRETVEAALERIFHAT